MYQTAGKGGHTVNVFVLMMTFLFSPEQLGVKVVKDKIINVLYWKMPGEFKTWSTY